MTIEEKKISLINWITTLEDEEVLDQMAENEPDKNLVKH